MRIPLTGGVAQLVMETGNSLNVVCATAPASLCLILETSRDGKQLVLTAFDPVKGRGKVLPTIEIAPSDVNYEMTALSPDGSTFAISRGNKPEIHIRLLSVSGGSGREITVKGWPNITSVE